MVQYLNNNNNFNSGFAAFMAAKNSGEQKQSKFVVDIFVFGCLVDCWIVYGSTTKHTNCQNR